MVKKKTSTATRIAGLWKLMYGYRKMYLLAILGMGIAAVARSSTYLLLGFFVDHVLQAGTSFGNILPWIAIGFIALAGIESGATFFGKKEAARTSELLTKQLREAMFDHIQRLTFTFHSQNKTGDLIQRSTSDIDAVRKLFSDQLINGGRVISLFIVNICILIALNVQLALISIIIVPVTILFAYLFFQRISAAYEAFQEQEAILSSVLQENLSGVRVVKAFARQQYEIEKFDKENQEKFKRGKYLLLMHGLYWPSSDILTGIQMLLGYFTGATLAIQGTISVGTYLSYAGMFMWIIWPIRNLGQLIVEMSKGLVSYERPEEIFQTEKEDLKVGDANQPKELRGEIIFKDVCFGYDDGNSHISESCEDNQMVLRNINFHCEPGQIIAFMGSTGSGKTTLANLLPRFYEYTSGSIKLDGVELNRYPRAYLRHHIGIVEQETFLFSATIRENIAYGVQREVSENDIQQAARAAVIHDNIMNFPEQYMTLVGEKGVTLSGGQKQRVAIARTILRNPRILILDDATSSVDTETEAEIRTALNNLMMGRTTFIIAHRIQSVMMADWILVLENGSVVQQGTHSDLITNEGTYRTIFEMQTRIESEMNKEFGNV